MRVLPSADRLWWGVCGQALLWLRFVDGVKLSPLDWLGAGVTLVGMAIIVSAWKAA